MCRIAQLVRTVVPTAVAVTLGTVLSLPAHAGPLNAAEAVQPPGPPPAAPGWAPPAAPGPAWQGRAGLGFGQGWAPGAWQRHHIGRMARPPLGRLLFRGIQLDEAQRTKVREITQQHRPELQKLNRALADARRALRQARAADPLDEAALRSSASAVATAEADLAIAQGRLRTDLLSVLTPEQQEAIDARRQAAQDRWQQLRERRQQLRNAPPPRKKD